MSGTSLSCVDRHKHHSYFGKICCHQHVTHVVVVCCHVHMWQCASTAFTTLLFMIINSLLLAAPFMEISTIRTIVRFLLVLPEVYCLFWKCHFCNMYAAHSLTSCCHHQIFWLGVHPVKIIYLYLIYCRSVMLTFFHSWGTVWAFVCFQVLWSW